MTRRWPRRPAPSRPEEPANEHAEEPFVEEGHVDDEHAEDEEQEPASLVVAGALILVATLLTLLVVTGLVVRAGLSSDEQAASTPAAGGRVPLSPRPPDGAPPVGAYVQSRIDARGEVRVRHWIRSPRPLDRIRIAPPMRPSGAEAVQVRELTVTAGGRPVSSPRTLGPDGRVVEVPRARQVYLSYTMDGVVERSPSVPGRALARETALGVSYGPRAGPTLLFVQGPEVLSSACVVTGAPRALPRPCGAPTESGWGVVLRGVDRDDSVMAQLNLT